MSVVEEIAQEWRLRLQQDYPTQDPEVVNSLVQWLVGDDNQRLEELDHADLMVARQSIEYRYRILQQRYWNVGPEQAYRRLIKRLSSLFLIRDKVRTWIALSRDRQRSVVDVVQEVIQEMLQSDRHLRSQLSWIACCTCSTRLSNLLTLATLEEYCLRPIRNQPLIVYRFVNYLRRIQKGGMTQVPSGELVRLVSDEISSDESDNSLSLLDVNALDAYEEQQTLGEQQTLRGQVKQKFLDYLSRTLDETAVQWLDLHLKGYPQEKIAEQLDLDIRQVYRLREKVSYHAIRVFTLKEQPDLVFSWLKTSLKEHSFGLTATQWESYWAARSLEEQTLLMAFKELDSIDEVAKRLGMKAKQVQTQWAQLYMEAQTVRSQQAHSTS